MNKESLRNKYLAIRSALPPVRKEQASLNLFLSLKKITARYRYVFSFMSFQSEIDLLKLNEFLLQESKLYLPAIHKGRMDFYKVSSLNHLEKSLMGFLSPSFSDIPSQIPDHTTLIIAPGVAFDLYGHRLGYGRGHYDEFFSRMPACKKISVGYQEQLYLSRFPFEDHDQELDASLFF